MSSTRMNAARGWIPCRVVWERGIPYFDLCFLGDIQFTDSTFSATIARAMQRPFSAAFLRRVPLAELDSAGPDPSGLIFHLSRPAARQLSESLRASHITVFGEPPVDTILHSPDLLRLFARAIASAANAPAYVLELAPWHALEIAQFTRAFPTTPWIFPECEPEEIARLVNQPEEWTLPGFISADRLDFDPSGIAPADLAGYRAALIQNILSRVNEHPSDHRMRSFEATDGQFQAF